MQDSVIFAKHIDTDNLEAFTLKNQNTLQTQIGLC